MQPYSQPLARTNHNSSGHECSFLNRVDYLRRQPNGETKLQALSIPRLIDTALLILPARLAEGPPGVPNLFRKRKSRNTLPRHSINLRRMTCVRQGPICEQGHERVPLIVTDAPFCQRRTLRRRFDRESRAAQWSYPRAAKRKAL